MWLLKIRKKKITKVQWVSQFFPYKHDSQLGMKKVSYTDFYEKPYRFAFRCVTNFCKVKGLTLEILPRNSYEGEHEYYKKMIEMPFNFLENALICF